MIFRNIDIKFDPRDIWVGVYWNNLWYGTQLACGKQEKWLLVYICIIPMLPIVLRFQEVIGEQLSNK